MRKTLLFLMLWVMGALTPVIAQNALTVADGTNTNEYVPIYGFYCDSYLKCEYVIPASSLTAMKDGKILGLTWYLSQSASASWGDVNFQVFVKEVADSTISAYSGTNGATMVYEGSLDGTGTTITIDFAEPVDYSGGNLLVGVYNTSIGAYKSAYFYGVTTQGAAVQGYNGSSLDVVTATQRNFIPKTTFAWIPGSGEFYYQPKNLAATNVGANSATITWEAGSTEAAWNLEYKKAADEQWTQVNGLTTTSYSLTELANATVYDVRVLSDYGEGKLSDWATTTFATDYCDSDDDKGEIYYSLSDSYGDGWNGNRIQIVNSATGQVVETLECPRDYKEGNGDYYTGSVKLCYGGTYKLMWVPGSYASECYFKFTTEGDSVIVEHASGSSPSSDLLATFTMAYVAAKKPTNLQVSDVTYNSATLTWTPGSEDQDTWIVAYFGENDTESTTEPVSENPTLALTNLEENTTYTAVVYASVNGELSQPSDAVVFKTPEQFTTPTNLEVTELNAKSAVVEWTGEAETYNLRYRKSNVLFFEGFENGLDNWTLVDADNDGNGWQILEPSTWNGDGYEYSAYEGVNVAMSRSWQNNNALTPDNWLISPKVDLGETLEYYISDDGEYQETYRVYVSVDGNDIADFVPLTDDLLSPGSQTWIKRSHDLSVYSGQSGYIAFRQYNCTDEDYMWIDAVTIKGSSNEEWTTVEGIEKDVYILEDLEPESTYEVQVQANYGEDTSNWSASLDFRTPSATTLPKIEGVDTGRDWAEVSWTGTQESYNLRYRTASIPGGFYEPFENGVPETWTTIDNDGDGFNWTNRTAGDDNVGNPTCFGDGCVTSASYNPSTQSALTPDNWLVTPQVELSGTLSVWLRGQDPNYAAEHFAIYVSTTGNTVNDFLASDDNILVNETTAVGILTEYTADLSSFNGAMGYVAIRHFNCKDQFYLNVDNFHISSSPDIPAGDWVVVEDVDSPYLIEGLEVGTEYEVEVQGIVDDETTTDWVSTTFNTQSASFMTLAEILENGVDEQSYKLDGDLYMVAQTNYDGNLMTYVTDNEGNWARVYGLTAAQFANYNTLTGLGGTLYFVDTAPTFVPTTGRVTTTDIDVEIRNIDLTQAVELPKACEVVNITGYFDGERIRAYSGQNGEMGQGILLASTSDGDLDFDEGTQIDVQLAIELREPWENAAPLPGPRRIAPTDPDALDNIVGNVVSSQETPIETGITTINGDRKNNGEVRYYDINGRYVGKSLEGVDKGIYIGTDGTKVRK